LKKGMVTGLFTLGQDQRTPFGVLFIFPFFPRLIRLADQPGADGTTWHIRKSGAPDTDQSEILKLLDITCTALADTTSIE